MHGPRGVDDEDDVFAVHRHAADRRVGDRPPIAQPEQSLHLLGELLLRREQAPLENLAHVRVLLGRRVLAADLGQVAPQSRDQRLLLRQLLDHRRQVALNDVGLAANLEQLLLQTCDQAVQVLARLLDGSWLADLRQHEQQHDGAESAADGVEEGETEALRVAAPASSAHAHGQSFDGLK